MDVLLHGVVTMYLFFSNFLDLLPFWQLKFRSAFRYKLVDLSLFEARSYLGGILPHCFKEEEKLNRKFDYYTYTSAEPGFSTGS